MGVEVIINCVTIKLSIIHNFQVIFLQIAGFESLRIPRCLDKIDSFHKNHDHMNNYSIESNNDQFSGYETTLSPPPQTGNSFHQ